MEYDIDKAVEFVKYMVDTYGVRSFLEDIDESEYYDPAGIWFECPECGEPILFCDYPEYFQKGMGCPVCEEEI